MRPRVFRDSRHSPSNAHTYRLLVFKERALRRLKNLPKQQSAKTTILARFAEACQPVGPSGLQGEGAVKELSRSPRSEACESTPRKRSSTSESTRRRAFGSDRFGTRAPGRRRRSRVRAPLPSGSHRCARMRCLIVDDLRRVHREAAQAHAEQELGEGRVARHLAAHAHVLAQPRWHSAIVCGHQLQHSRMPGVVEMRDGFVGAVDRQRVLDQVVGADRDEVEVTAGTPAASAPPPAPRSSRRARPAP